MHAGEANVAESLTTAAPMLLPEPRPFSSMRNQGRASSAISLRSVGNKPVVKAS